MNFFNEQALDSYISSVVERLVKSKVRERGPEKQWLNQKESAKYMVNLTNAINDDHGIQPMDGLM